ncbi:MAG: ATP-binding cassette domain-containing protein [Proteobacteria bacterium]|nr:MAG: ATP-binding cassette domain-containing protein [Pseudomonadota bacterium]
MWLLKAERKFGLTAAGLGVAGQFYSKLVNLMIMGLAAYLAIRGDLSPGQVVATTMIAGGVLTPLTTLANQIGLIQEVKAVCARLDDIFSAPSETTKKHGQLRKETLIGEIEFHDVWFRYGGEGSDWILKGVSFKIEAGQNVALVGPSGSGKSTIAALLARMFVPTKGQIFIDGRDYLDYDVSWLRTQIGLLHQETHLFHGSILSNIAYADPEPEIGSVHAAAEKAAAREFIDKKPNGFDYLISSGGLGLSVGEKQRVALARMFYRQPQILLLDEATSALDGIAEAKLLHNLREQTKDLTTINIAHRYSTVRYSDFALVMSDGRVVGFGIHEELWAENSVYQELFAAQFDVVGQASKGSAA